jgi:aryl-alcohol dehydrogenase-like predicted oxidoreductase
MMKTNRRRLGRSDLWVSAIGLGCNAIGGPIWDRSMRADLPIGYGNVDDTQSVQAIRRALELGITFFDTADEYGCGHSERILARALGAQSSSVVISSKFGITFNERTREITGQDASPAYIRKACEASLRRLKRDWIDIYLLHIRDLSYDRAEHALETLEELVAEGKIRWYGWSTDDVERARFFNRGRHCAVIEHRLNLLLDAAEMLALCEELDLASVNRIPLLMGILSGRYHRHHLPPQDDVRSLFFDHKAFLEDLDKVERVKTVLTKHGRSMAQGALAWILARSQRAVPIPGFRTVEQVEDNAGVFSVPPMTQDDLDQIQALVRS